MDEADQEAREKQGGKGKVDLVVLDEKLVELFPVLLICKDIKTANNISEEIKSCLPSIKTIPYWRDDSQELPRDVKFTFKKKEN